MNKATRPVLLIIFSCSLAFSNQKVANRDLPRFCEGLFPSDEQEQIFDLQNIRTRFLDSLNHLERASEVEVTTQFHRLTDDSLSKLRDGIAAIRKKSDRNLSDLEKKIAAGVEKIGLRTRPSFSSVGVDYICSLRTLDPKDPAAKETDAFKDLSRLKDEYCAEIKRNEDLEGREAEAQRFREALVHLRNRASFSKIVDGCRTACMRIPADMKALHGEPAAPFTDIGLQVISWRGYALPDLPAGIFHAAAAAVLNAHKSPIFEEVSALYEACKPNGFANQYYFEKATREGHSRGVLCYDNGKMRKDCEWDFDRFMAKLSGKEKAREPVPLEQLPRLSAGHALASGRPQDRTLPPSGPSPSPGLKCRRREWADAVGIRVVFTCTCTEADNPYLARLKILFGNRPSTAALTGNSAACENGTFSVGEYLQTYERGLDGRAEHTLPDKITLVGPNYQQAPMEAKSQGYCMATCQGLWSVQFPVDMPREICVAPGQFEKEKSTSCIETCVSDRGEQSVQRYWANHEWRFDSTPPDSRKSLPKRLDHQVKTCTYSYESSGEREMKEKTLGSLGLPFTGSLPEAINSCNIDGLSYVRNALSSLYFDFPLLDRLEELESARGKNEPQPTLQSIVSDDQIGPNTLKFCGEGKLDERAYKKKTSEDKGMLEYRRNEMRKLAHACQYIAAHPHVREFLHQFETDAQAAKIGIIRKPALVAAWETLGAQVSRCHQKNDSRNKLTEQEEALLQKFDRKAPAPRPK